MIPFRRTCEEPSVSCLSHLGTSCRQDYDAMVKLVEALETLPTCALADQQNVKFHYAFALNR